MISMTVTNHLDESLELVLAEPERTGLLVSEINGLGEPDAQSNLTSIGLSDYSRLNSVRLKPRPIEIKLVYYGDDIEGSRLKAYKYFPTKKVIKLKFKTQYREVECKGVVKKNEPIIFTSNRTSFCGCTIDVECPDPYLYDIGTVTTVFDGIKPLFTFPFSDAPADKLQFGNIRILKDKTVYYVGEEETGVTINIHCLGIVRDLTIYNLNTGQQLGIRDDILEQLLGSSLMASDDVIITTIKGNKSAYLIRNGITHNIINAISKRANHNDWFELSNGDNLFTYTASQGDLDVMMNIKHRILYKGV